MKNSQFSKKNGSWAEGKRETSKVTPLMETQVKETLSISFASSGVANQ